MISIITALAFVIPGMVLGYPPILVIVGVGVLIFGIRSLPDAFAAIGREKKLSVREPRSEATVPDQLAKLVEMHETGVLTDDEYAAAKAKVLE